MDNNFYRNRKDNIINFEVMGGWPVHKMNIRDIIQSLNFKHEDGKWSIDDDNEILDIYPRTLEDDGMGYGVNEKYVIEADQVDHDKINLFIESNLAHIEAYQTLKASPGDEVYDTRDNIIYVLTDEVKIENNITYFNCAEMLYEDEGEDISDIRKKWINIENLSPCK